MEHIQISHSPQNAANIARGAQTNGAAPAKALHRQQLPAAFTGLPYLDCRNVSATGAFIMANNSGGVRYGVATFVSLAFLRGWSPSSNVV